jgi:hypothetical protein
MKQVDRKLTVVDGRLPIELHRAWEDYLKAYANVIRQYSPDYLNKYKLSAKHLDELQNIEF